MYYTILHMFTGVQVGGSVEGCILVYTTQKASDGIFLFLEWCAPPPPISAI